MQQEHEERVRHRDPDLESHFLIRVRCVVTGGHWHWGSSRHRHLRWRGTITRMPSRRMSQFTAWDEDGEVFITTCSQLRCATSAGSDSTSASNPGLPGDALRSSSSKEGHAMLKLVAYLGVGGRRLSYTLPDITTLVSHRPFLIRQFFGLSEIL